MRDDSPVERCNISSALLWRGKVLSEEERAEMVASLKAAEARIKAGQFVEHDPKTFVDRLMNVRASAAKS